MDPAARCAVMSLYEGLAKILPLEGGFRERAYNVRLEEQDVLDMTFLIQVGGGGPSAGKEASTGLASRSSSCSAQASTAPALAVLFRGGDDRVRVSTYDVALKDRSLTSRPWAGGGAVQPGATLLIPLAAPPGALLALGGDQVTVICARGSDAVPCPPLVPRYGATPRDGSWHVHH